MVKGWIPSKEVIKEANITRFMERVGIRGVKALHQWSVDEVAGFWGQVIEVLGIRFKSPPQQMCDFTNGIEKPNWLVGAEMNIVDSCLASTSETAILYWDNQKQLQRMSYLELDQLSNRIANGLVKRGFSKGDAMGIAMPMDRYAIAIYLGIIKMGGVVVSIADSFSSHEMAVRLSIAKAKIVFTQEEIVWGEKHLPLYEKLCQAQAPMCVVLPVADSVGCAVRESDCAWASFLSTDAQFTSVACEPMQACNILFSSGTTADPKAIAWNHTTGIKVASDAFFHHNIQPGDVLAWPTNLGWMMGPWLIYAALMHHATIALYPGIPKERAFGEFIQAAKVTMLGVVPTLVASWRQTQCMENLDWGSIKVFSSTGECSNEEDMAYLMGLAGNKPIIEYCGGTEIGGGYLTSTVVQPNYPAQFSTKAMGIDFVILDEAGEPAEMGEVALIPPSVGLSTALLNADHQQVYYEGMPWLPNGKRLRRHGDQVMHLPDVYWVVLGRVDDTMNLGGIKISAAEIERALHGLEGVVEVAAVAINPVMKGPSHLVIYAATQNLQLDKRTLQQNMQQKINTLLNPLFKIHDIVIVPDLPKTASNKIMRRVLRKTYTESQL